MVEKTLDMQAGATLKSEKVCRESLPRKFAEKVCQESLPRKFAGRESATLQPWFQAAADVNGRRTCRSKMYHNSSIPSKYIFSTS